MTLRIAHSNITPVTEKRLPLYKDRRFIEALKKQAIRENNERLRKRKQA